MKHREVFAAVACIVKVVSTGHPALAKSYLGVEKGLVVVVAWQELSAMEKGAGKAVLILKYTGELTAT